MILDLDFTNMMVDAVGPEQGVREEELSAFVPRCRQIYDRLDSQRRQGELPFFDLPFDRGIVAQIEEMAAWVRDRFDDVVVLGIGGSALGTTAVMNALRPAWHNLADRQKRGGMPRLFVLDNVDPDTFAEHLELLDPDRTCFLVISKSGSTVETTCQFLVARNWVATHASSDYHDHFILITDPEKGALRELATREGYRSCEIPPGVGGRFTVLTPVSLLPLACAGVDIDGMLAGAAAISPSVCHGELMSNPAGLNAVLQYLAYSKGAHISVMMPYSSRLSAVADWFRQLWAESLGKKFSTDGRICHVGPTPVSALGTTDQHSQVQLYMEGPFDKVVTFLAVEKFDQDLTMPACPGASGMGYLEGGSMAQLIEVERLATAAALARNQRPNCTLSIPEVSAQTIGALLYTLQVQTLFAGDLFGVNPLDQPGVEEGKAFTYALMGRSGYEDKRLEFEALRARTEKRGLTSG